MAFNGITTGSGFSFSPQGCCIRCGRAAIPVIEGMKIESKDRKHTGNIISTTFAILQGQTGDQAV